MRETSLLKQLARALMSGQTLAAADIYRPHWHLAPAVGLLNDPNGLIQHKGRYHLFYQWNPLACAHGAKFWGHWSSSDLLRWRHEPVALVPGEEYDRNGCYSGSAVVCNGKIVLAYTGNVKFPDGSRTANQCLAVENEQGEFDKLGSVLALPDGYSGHVRDPKIWRHEESWYMVLGAQDLHREGKVLLFRSEDLHHWQKMGEIAGSGLGGLGEFGYMWECPDLFTLAGQELLICCPQGVPAQGERYLNTFQTGYLLGRLDYESGHFSHGAFSELDLGFEFYAPQTTQTEDGRRLLFAWMGIPDGDEFYQPTLQKGWMHIMSCPRELSLIGNQLYQQPARELKRLRQEEFNWQGSAAEAPKLSATSAELLLHPSGPFQLSLAHTLDLSWDGARLTLSRKNLRTGQIEMRFWRGELEQIQLLLDSSSAEIFINQGAAAMSSRYFPAEKPIITWHGTSALTLRYWPLARCVIE